MRLSFNLVAGGTLVTCAALLAVVGAVWTPHDPIAIGFASRLQPPNSTHWLGTDEFGRDIVSRLMRGAGPSLAISSMSVALALTIGIGLGTAGGYFRGWVDRALMIAADALLAFPGILLALALLAVFGPNPAGLVLALGIAFSPSVARVVRGTVMSIRQRDYIDASRLMGSSQLYTICRHVLPNCAAPVVVLTTSMLGWALLAESALSFLGLGVAPPAPTWGNMLSASRAFLNQAPWLGIFPGVMISLSLLGINLLGDGLRDLLDPRMREI